MRRLPAILAILFLVTGCGTTGDAERVVSRDEPNTASRPGGGGASKPGGEAAPGFTVTTFEGERFVLAEQRGTPVVLNFWESW